MGLTTQKIIDEIKAEYFRIHNHTSTDVEAKKMCCVCTKDAAKPRDASIRKSTPNHAGRISKAERKALEQLNSIHQARDLREMLTADSQLEDYHVEFVIKTVKHWLNDIEHECRMRKQINEQDTVSRIIEKVI
jgi:hypothetical protein